MQFSSKAKLLRTVSNNRAAEQNCLSLLQACTSLSHLTQIHCHFLKLGLQNNPLVLTKFTSTSSNLNAINYASSLLFSSNANNNYNYNYNVIPLSYDAFLFNTVIRAYAQTGSHSNHTAIYYYKLMLEYGVLPNKFTYPFVLKACACVGRLSLGEQVHGFVIKMGFDNDLHVMNTLVHMYGCCIGGIGFARKVFDEMPDSDSVSWSAMIGGYARLGMSSEAVGLFREMQVSGVRPDEVTMVSVLSACTDLGALELGKWVESYVEREKVPKSVELCNVIIDMYAKCGDVDKAVNLFRSMSGKTIVSWTSVIVGMAMHGRGLEAVSLFEEMKENGLVPDDVVFIGLLSACSHSGLVEEGWRYFNSMLENFGIVPKIEHYGCMVDLLSRAGLVKEALDFVQKMPIKPNQIIWQTLIAACGSQGELNLGESITKQLIRNEPMHEGNYILLSNIYAKKSHWEKKTRIREVMEKKGMRKIPGSTMIELDNEIYEFVAGDQTHNCTKRFTRW